MISFKFHTKSVEVSVFSLPPGEYRIADVNLHWRAYMQPVAYDLVEIQRRSSLINEHEVVAYFTSTKHSSRSGWLHRDNIERNLKNQSDILVRVL